MTTPLLTIVIPNYNNGRHLEAAVRSILQNSDHQDLEVLIIDDQSTDNSKEIIANLCSQYPVKAFFRKKNEGVISAINAGLQLAKGKYLHFFASDDLYLPNATTTILKVLNTYPKLEILSSDYTSFSEDLSHFKNNKLLPAKEFIFFNPHQVFSLFRHTQFWIPGHTVIVKRETFLKYAPLDKRLYSTSDWFINHNIALDYGLGYFPGGLIATRENPYSYSSNISDTHRKNMWTHLLMLFQSKKYAKLSSSGICRMLGLKAIFPKLIFTPKYWKFLAPMVAREFEQKIFSFFGINCERFWLRRLLGYDLIYDS